MPLWAVGVRWLRCSRGPTPGLPASRSRGGVVLVSSRNENASILEGEVVTDDGEARPSGEAQTPDGHLRESASDPGQSGVPWKSGSCLVRFLWAVVIGAGFVGLVIAFTSQLEDFTDGSEAPSDSGTESAVADQDAGSSEPTSGTDEPSTTVSTTSPVGPGESTVTLDASRCDTADEVAVEAWQFTEGEVFYGVGEGRNWFLCLYGDGVAGRIGPLWDKAIDNTYVITGDTYRFESNWPTLFEPLGTEYLSTRVFEMTRTGDVLEGVVVWTGWELASVYAEGSATPEWVAIEQEPETVTVRAVLLPRSS